MIALASMVNDPGTLPTLVRELMSVIPEPEQEQAQAELLQAIAGLFTRFGVALPEWLLAARGETEREEPPDPEYLRFVYAVMLCEAARLATRRAAEKHPSGITSVARATGLSPTTLRRFIAGSLGSPDIWAKLAEYTEPRNQGPPAHGLMGLSLLTATLPSRVRRGARAFLAHTLSGYLDAHGAPEPSWLAEERHWR